LLEKAADVVVAEKRDESLKIREQHNQFIREQLSKQDAIKNDMVLKSIQAEMDLPYDVCISITDETRETTFREVCGKIGEDLIFVKDINKCLTNEGWCESCCNFHLGTTKKVKR